MAGGSGERFWPLSRYYRPKQLLKLGNPDKTMLQEAIERMSLLIPADQIYIATGRHLQKAIRQEKLPIADINILAEPYKRNTLGCLCYIAAKLLADAGKESDKLILGVVTADHKIDDRAAFQNDIDRALTIAENENCLTTIGIPPERPETGYGYIEIDTRQDSEKKHPAPAEAIRFVEKPTQKNAESFFTAGNYLWNSGMFFYRLSVFLNELEEHQPEAAAIVYKISESLKNDNPSQADNLFAELPDISFDYAIMERAARSMVVPASFSWNDVGSWDALDRTLPKDENGNISIGDPILIDTQNCIVFNEDGLQNKAVSVIGVRDMVVAISNDGIIVVPKNRSQDVKKAVAELRKKAAGKC